MRLLITSAVLVAALAGFLLIASAMAVHPGCGPRAAYPPDLVPAHADLAGGHRNNASRRRRGFDQGRLALARGAATSAESAAIEPATAACCANAGRAARAITSARTSRTAPCLARNMAAGVRRLWRALEFVTRSSLKNHAPIMPVNRDHLVQKKLKIH